MTNLAQQTDGQLSIPEYMHQVGRKARAASRVIAAADGNQKNRALLETAEYLLASAQALMAANRKDLEAARENSLAAPLLDRLELTPARIESMADGLRQIAGLPDPVGEISELKYQPSGLQVGRMRVPLGVIGIIYESRPNVTADAAALCLKSGNAAILRGGSEALNSNQAIAACIQYGLAAAGLPADVVQLVETTDRAAVGALLGLSEFVDIIIPRGGKGLVSRIAEEARVPVIKHLDGICHVYVDNDADLDKAVQIAVNSKTYRYGICGAAETLLVDAPVAAGFLRRVGAELRQHGVEIRGCEATCQILPEATPASDEDWRTEYLGPILSVRVVDGLKQAVQHITDYGSGHTDAIVTENLAHARQFMREVDSSSVMVNAATCFADGYQYGLGAEIGISTDKLHVRGPVGLEGLTTRKFIVLGDGTIRT